MKAANARIRVWQGPDNLWRYKIEFKGEVTPKSVGFEHKQLRNEHGCKYVRKDDPDHPQYGDLARETHEMIWQILK